MINIPKSNACHFVNFEGTNRGISYQSNLSSFSSLFSCPSPRPLEAALTCPLPWRLLTTQWLSPSQSRSQNQSQSQSRSTIMTTITIMVRSFISLRRSSLLIPVNVSGHAEPHAAASVMGSSLTAIASIVLAVIYM